MLKRMISFLLVLCVCLSITLLGSPPIPVSAGTQATYYVDPVNGNNANSGTSTGSALRTIAAVRDKVRGINSNMTGDIYVFLMNGTYTQTSTLSFGSSDSGTNGYNVYYKANSGATPVISGGKLITGWTLHDSIKNIYKATVASTDNFRQLYVNGVKKQRAAGSAPTGITYSADNTYFTSTDKSFIGYTNQSAIELVSAREWGLQRALVSSITDNGSTAKFNMLAPYFKDIVIGQTQELMIMETNKFGKQ